MIEGRHDVFPRLVEDRDAVFRPVVQLFGENTDGVVNPDYTTRSTDVHRAVVTAEAN